jgi:hypothetical protein
MTGPESSPSASIRAHPVDIGQRTEAIILAELVKRGHRVLVPFGDTERVYAVSVEEDASSEGTLRVAPTANGQAKGIRWASDHELPA